MDKTQVKEVMSEAPYAVSPSTSLRAAAKVMEEHECGALPVCDEDGVLRGILTDRDVVIFGLAADKDPDADTVADIMNSPVFTCTQEETLAHAADVMSEQSVRRLVVIDHEGGDICGIISMSDMIKCTDKDEVNDEVLHHLFKYA
jgi:CBS domain-containing protein